ncbi:MAG: FecR domain-containing protein [Bacteroidales bacterium]|nr:FecR domain-containing protein [Bacteroidales bacterium]
MNMNDYKGLSFRYFEGKLSLEEEKDLYGFISHGNNKKVFREWEKEWISTSSASEKVLRSWASLKSRIAAREALNERGNGRKPTMAWRFVFAAASVAALVIGTLFLFHRESAPEIFTYEAPVGTRGKIILPDSSIVWLNSGTTLKVTNAFGKKDRDVHLSGEGFFEVTKSKDIPFIVKTADCSITVHGTKFDVTAYASDNYVRTSVLEGEVWMQHANLGVDIKAGQTVEYLNETGSFRRTVAKPESISAWRENRIEFEDISLRDLADILSRNYGIKVLILSEKAAGAHLSISLRNNESIDEIIKGLREVLHLKITREDNNILIQ